jgi:hypothetical protein
LVSIDEYKEYLTFQGPVYEQYRHYIWGGCFLHFANKEACERWLAARNRFSSAFDERNYRDIHGELNCSFQRRDECDLIMQEAVEEMDACCSYEKILDFCSWPKPALAVHQLQFLVDELLARYQRYSEFLKNWNSAGERAEFELVEPILSKKFQVEPRIWRDPLPISLWEYLSYDLGAWLWISLRDYPHVFWGKFEEEVLPQFYDLLKRLGFELAY